MSIRIIRVLSLVIMVAAASVSFGTQRGIFLHWHVDGYASVVGPLSIDLLAILCNLTLHTDGVERNTRGAGSRCWFSSSRWGQPLRQLVGRRDDRFEGGARGHGSALGAGGVGEFDREKSKRPRPWIPSGQRRL
jgi:hypothetical protein